MSTAPRSLFENHSALPILTDCELAKEGDLIMFFAGDQIVGWITYDLYELLWETMQ